VPIYLPKRTSTLDPLGLTIKKPGIMTIAKIKGMMRNGIRSAASPIIEPIKRNKMIVSQIYPELGETKFSFEVILVKLRVKIEKLITMISL